MLLFDTSVISWFAPVLQKNAARQPLDRSGYRNTASSAVSDVVAEIFPQPGVQLGRNCAAAAGSPVGAAWSCSDKMCCENDSIVPMKSLIGKPGIRSEITTLFSSSLISMPVLSTPKVL